MERKRGLSGGTSEAPTRKKLRSSGPVELAEPEHDEAEVVEEEVEEVKAKKTDAVPVKKPPVEEREEKKMKYVDPNRDYWERRRLRRLESNKYRTMKKVSFEEGTLDTDRSTRVSTPTDTRDMPEYNRRRYRPIQFRPLPDDSW